jgi:hypothetical protein
MSLMDIVVARHAGRTKDASVLGFLLFLGIIIVLTIIIAGAAIIIVNTFTEESVINYTDETVTGKEIRNYTSKGGYEHTSYVVILKNGTEQKFVLVDKATYDTVAKGSLYSYGIPYRHLKKFF